MKWYIVNKEGKPTIVKVKEEFEKEFLDSKPLILEQASSLGEVLQKLSEQLKTVS